MLTCEQSRRFGQWHPRAVLTDSEVAMLRRLRREGWSYKALMTTFEVSKWCVGRLCRYERRVGAGG
jgi:hypothetical protein